MFLGKVSHDPGNLVAGSGFPPLPLAREARVERVLRWCKGSCGRVGACGRSHHRKNTRGDAPRDEVQLPAACPVSRQVVFAARRVISITEFLGLRRRPSVRVSSSALLAMCALPRHLRLHCSAPGSSTRNSMSSYRLFVVSSVEPCDSRTCTARR